MNEVLQALKHAGEARRAAARWQDPAIGVRAIPCHIELIIDITRPVAHSSTAECMHSAHVRTFAGFTLDPPVVQAMMHRHDPDNDSRMSLDDFIRM